MIPVSNDGESDEPSFVWLRVQMKTRVIGTGYSGNLDVVSKLLIV